MHNGEVAQKQLERLTFFSDAVFAIAMTLLVIEVKVPHIHGHDEMELAQALIDLVPQYIGFVLSFLVIGRFWFAHHILMGALKACTPRLVWRNMLMLMAIAFMPFPTAVMSDYAALSVAVGFYAAWLTVLGLLNRWLILTGIKNRVLMRKDADDAAIANILRASWIPLILGPAAFAAGMLMPLAGVAVLVVGTLLIGFIMRRLGKAAAG